MVGGVFAMLLRGVPMKLCRVRILRPANAPLARRATDSGSLLVRAVLHRRLSGVVSGTLLLRFGDGLVLWGAQLVLLAARRVTTRADQKQEREVCKWMEGELHIDGLNGVVSVGPEFYGNDTTVIL